MNVKVNTATGVGFSVVSMLHSHDTVKFGKRYGRLSLPIRWGILSVFFLDSVISMKTSSTQNCPFRPFKSLPRMTISLHEMVTLQSNKSFCPGKISDPDSFDNLVFPYFAATIRKKPSSCHSPLQNVRAKLQIPRKSGPRYRTIYRCCQFTKWEKHYSIGKNIENNALFCVIINRERVVNLIGPDEPCGWPVIHRANLLMKLKTSLTCKQPISQTRIDA